MRLHDSAPPGRGMYCNRTLNMRSIKVVGYDMDYTLVHYRVEDWERRAYNHIKQRLLDRGLPIAMLSFDAQLVVRGVIMDTHRGNFLKTNRFGYIKRAYHGTQLIDHVQVRREYMRRVVSLRNPRYRFMNTLFALSEGCLYAQLVDLLDAGALGEHALGYQDLYELVRDHANAAHTEGELKAEIMRDPARYVEREEDTVLTLLDQKHAGKRLMLITNSEWPYTLAMMRFAFDSFMPKGQTWRDLFEVVIVAARKPAFFDSQSPLLEIVDDDGLMRPLAGALNSDHCYFGGNAVALEQHLGVSGDEILYLGDHIFGDVHVSKLALSWRTCLVLRELEEELRAEENTREVQLSLNALMREKEQLEWQYYQLRMRMQRLKAGYGPATSVDETTLTAMMAQRRNAIEQLDLSISPQAAEAGRAHNPRWGLMLRAGNDKSQLARQLERYADVYTSRVSNLLFASPFAYLRSRRGSMPHDEPHACPAPVSRG